MREAENIAAVEQLGVDMMGFIFYERSPRCVQEMPAYLPDVKRVGVFVDAPLGFVLVTVRKFGLQAVQLHGGESPLFCRLIRTFGVEVIKAFPVVSAADLETCGRYDLSCDYFLFDAKTDQYGGSGCRFDWKVLDYYDGKTPFLLSGGISETDAGSIAALHHPAFAGVDLNSRFEQSPALKNVTALDRFIRDLKELKIYKNDKL